MFASVPNVAGRGSASPRRACGHEQTPPPVMDSPATLLPPRRPSPSHLTTHPFFPHEVLVLLVLVVFLGGRAAGGGLWFWCCAGPDAVICCKGGGGGQGCDEVGVRGEAGGVCVEFWQPHRWRRLQKVRESGLHQQQDLQVVVLLWSWWFPV